MRSTLPYKSPLLHEIVHQFGARVNYNRILKWKAENHNFQNIFSGSHWLYSGAKEIDPAPGTTMPYEKGSLPLGQLGGFRESSIKRCDEPSASCILSPENGFPAHETYSIEPSHFNSNGTRAIYNDRELYIMGLIPFSEVLEEWSWVRRARTARFTAGGAIVIYTDRRPSTSGSDRGFYTITKEQYYEYLTLPNADGSSIPVSERERKPDHTTSQKHFNALALIIQDPSNPLTAEQLMETRTQLRQMSMPMSDGTDNTNFWEATGGRATIEFGKARESLFCKLKNSEDTVTARCMP